MPTSPLYLGIDFGTTNSSVGFVYGDPRHQSAQSVPVEPVKFTMDEENHVTVERMPSVLSTRFDDRRAKGILSGWEFLNNFGKKKKAPLLRRGRELFDSVKSDLGSHRVYAHASGESSDYNTPRKVATGIFRALLDGASNRLPSFDAGKIRTFITVPASLNAEARRETREAAVGAGLNADLIELIDEPIAALLHLLNHQSSAAVLSMQESKNVLVFDYGGGTLDLCLVKCSYNLDAPNGLEAETLAISQYCRNGGNDVDRAIMEEVVWPQVEEQMGKKSSDFPADLRRAVEDTLTSTLARKLKEKLCIKLSKLVEAGEDYTRIRGDLSETVATTGDFHDDRLPCAIRGRFKMTKAQFDKVMEPFLRARSYPSGRDHGAESRSLILPIWSCLSKAGLDSEDLDVLVLHGGSCRNPYVVRHLKRVLAEEESLFGRTTIMETPNLDTSVACGAALACYWKHERGVELIKPVTAEDIGIITLGGTPVCLVESGSPLPFPEAGVHEHPADFYVAQNAQKELIVPFYAGRTEGEPRLSGTVKIALPEDVQKGDLVKLKLSVDKNKIMQWWYRVGNGEFKQARPFDDPWTPRRLNPDEGRVVAFRRKMEEALSAGGKLEEWMLLQEANLCRLAGNLNEAELLLLDLMSANGLTGALANLLALVYSASGKVREKLHFGGEAARLSPGDAVFVGNYGYFLADAGRVDEAISQMRLALGKDPNLYYLYERLGDIARGRSDEQGALKEYRQAIHVLERRSVASPASGDVWYSLARLYHMTGDYEQSATARSRMSDARLNEIYEGDHRHRIAGPDSGFLPSH